MKSRVALGLLCLLLLSVVVGVASAVLTDPTAAYNFDDVNLNNSLYLDLSGNGYHQLSMQGADTGEDGVINQSIGFVRANTDTPALPYIPLSTAGGFAISAWQNLTDAASGSWEEIVSYTEDGNFNHVAYGLMRRDDGKYEFIIGNAAGTGLGCDARSTTTYVADAVHHVVGMYNHSDGNCYLYVDGIQKASAALASAYSPVGDETTALGWENYTGTIRYFQGSIDILYMYDHVLTTAEILTLYNGGSGTQLIPNNVAPSTNFTITATNTYTAAAINTFNASITWNGTTTNYTTSTGMITTTIPLGSGLANVTVTANNYFSNTTRNVNTSSNHQSSNIPYTRIMFFDLVNSSYVENFSVSFNSSSYLAVGNASYIPLFNQTALVTATASGYAVASENLTASPYLENYTFGGYTNNSVSFFIRDVVSDSLITSENITISLRSTDLSYSSTIVTDTGLAYVDLLSPLSYIAEFSGASYDSRSYAFTLYDSTHREVTAYLSNSTSPISFTVQSTLASAISGASITIFQNVNGSIVGVAAALTDVFGNAVINLDTSKEYLIVVSASGFNQFSGYFTPSASSYTISLEPSSAVEYVSPFSDVRFNISDYYSNGSIVIDYEVFSASGILESFQVASAYNGSNYINLTTTSVGGGMLQIVMSGVNLSFQRCVNITYAFDADGFPTYVNTYESCYSDVVPTDISIGAILSLVDLGDFGRAVVAYIFLIIGMVSAWFLTRKKSFLSLVAASGLGLLTYNSLLPSPAGYVACVLIVVLIIGDEVAK